jgi:hypothetical protein
MAERLLSEWEGQGVRLSKHERSILVIKDLLKSRLHDVYL